MIVAKTLKRAANHAILKKVRALKRGDLAGVLKGEAEVPSLKSDFLILANQARRRAGNGTFPGPISGCGMKIDGPGEVEATL